MKKPIHFSVDPDRCTRCGLCVRDCVVDVIRPDADGCPVVSREDEPYCIRCRHCLAVCPTGALSIFGETADHCLESGPLPPPDTMLNLLRQRRSIRHYNPESLDPETMQKLKSCLRWTPTGCNDHRLIFRIVEKPEDMISFREKINSLLKLLIRTGILRLVYPNYKRYLSKILTGEDMIFRNAPHMITVLTPADAPCREADPWIALSYFDLMAQSLGVGTCWCGFALYAFRYSWSLKRLLKVPRGYRVGAVLLFGKPAVAYSRVPVPDRFPD